MSLKAKSMLVLEDVQFGFPNRPEFLGPVSLSIGGGQHWAIVGPNGAGKSTLLRLMAGLTKPTQGVITLGGAAVADIPARERARRVALVPQQVSGDIDLSVREVVLLGRFPHRPFGLFENAEDLEIVEGAMQRTATLPFAERRMATLSGGEAQRVHLAAALAQEPELLLLDEPTASLDLRHQLDIFGILRDRAVREGLAVVVVTHDVNLAAQFCSDVLVLNDGVQIASGPPAEVLTPEILQPVYGVDLSAIRMAGDSPRWWIVPAGEAAGNG